MKPVSNSTPLIHLARIGQLDLLRILYGVVESPPAVFTEVERYAPNAISAAEAAGWLLRASPADLAAVVELERALGGPGEAEAVALALERTDALLLVDERAARELAKRRGLAVRGTLGTLVQAKRSGHVPAVAPLLKALRDTGFWIDDETYDAALRLALE